jgi:hypothetical protein
VAASRSKLALRPSAVDGYEGAIVSIGPLTDTVLDRFQLDDSLIPRLRKLTQNFRSSRWEQKLREREWALSYEQAVNISRALQGDISRVTTDIEVSTWFLFIGLTDFLSR